MVLSFVRVAIGSRINRSYDSASNLLTDSVRLFVTSWYFTNKSSFEHLTKIAGLNVKGLIGIFTL